MCEVLKKSYPIIIAGLMAWYVLMCCVNYTYQRPLWNDEAAVFLSLEQLQPKEFFTKHLVGDQVFPRVHLFLIQTIAKPFNLSLLSVRLLSFIFMLSAFFCWMKVMNKAIKDRLHFATYVLCWCSSAALIYYSAELKQYSMDVLSSGIFMLFLSHQLKLEQKEHRKKLMLMLAGLPALILFSYVSFFFFIFPLYNLILSQKKDKSLRPCIVIYVMSLLVFCTFVYFFDMRLRTVWGYDDYFIYYTSFGDFFKTWGEGTTNLFTRWLVERPRIVKKIVLSFFVFGLIHMFVSFFFNIKKEKYYMHSVTVIALALYGEMFIMGSLKKYPFSVPRTSLFFCPIVLYLTVQGIVSTKRIHPLVYRILLAAFILLLLFIAYQISYLFLQGQIWSIPKIWWFGA